MPLWIMLDKMVSALELGCAEETGAIAVPLTLCVCVSLCVCENSMLQYLSPVFFTTPVEEIFISMNTEAGININAVRLSNLRFADDIVLFAESEEKLKDRLEELNKKGKKDGMTLTKKKTKIVCNEDRGEEWR